MSAGEQRGRKPRADVQRNRAALLETAQRHFLRHGVGTSLEAVANEAGVGPATLYRHFPLTIPCDILISATDQYVRAAQLTGRVRASVRGHDLFLAACSVAWIKGTGTGEESLDRLRTLIASGYRQQDIQA
ncbi:TetR family transcriptional regulator [Streptomyces sp. NPDC050619]|uniref:TetR/AcrR family transcriptional regulator n=1 Tax=Streptomyces sp. NPDC050619 TaxID=3157214 RepID=UPI00342176C1